MNDFKPTTYDYGVELYEDETVYPDVLTKHILDLKCGRCGYNWRLALQPENRSARAEVEAWKNQYLSLRAEITELMRFTETYYGMNPYKDQLLAILDGLRGRVRKKLKGEDDE